MNNDPTISVPSSNSKTYKRFIILALITAVLTLATGDRATLSVAGPDMQLDLGLSKVEIGWLFSAFSWAYVICMPIAGWLGDTLGSKKSMFVAIIAWSICTIFMGFASYFPHIVGVLLVLRFLLGISESPVGPNSGRIIAGWFPSQERGVAGAIFNSAQYASLAIFTPLMAWLCHQWGWEHVFWVMGAIGVVVAVIWIKFFHIPTMHPTVNQEELDYIRAGGALVDFDTDLNTQKTNQKVSQTKPKGQILQLFKSRMLCGIFLAQYCINAITWFFMSWFPIYLVQARGFSILQAGFMASIPALCGLVGGISSGFFSDSLLRKTNNLSLARKVPITIGMLLSASMILCNYVNSEVLVIFLMSAAFFGKGFGSLGWAVISDTAPKEIVGTTGGIFNSLGNIAGIITPVVIGYIIQTTGSFNGALIYVGLHGLVALASYWLIVGKIQRLELK